MLSRPPQRGCSRGRAAELDGLLGPREVRELAGQLGVRPTKTRGQNFLVDPNTVRRLVRLAVPRPDETVLEIGPGLGALTLGLLPASGRVLAVEVDPVLAAALPATAERQVSAAAGRLSVVLADALTVTAADLPGTPTLLAANLPYNIAVPVLLGLLERMPTLERGLVMVQAEVAARLTAPAGSRIYGVPSVKLAWWASSRWAGGIAPTVFWPQPHVESGLVAFERRPAPAADELRHPTFTVVDAAFAQRRKTLRAALAGWAGSADAAERRLRAAGIDPRARGEQLDVADYARLAATAG